MPEARTITEAYLHISLAVAGGEPGRNPDHRPWTTLTEGEDAWTLVFDRDGHHIELRIPYATEHAARRDDLHFGPGTSTLIDAGQWVLTGAAYARMALEDDLLSSPDAALGWRLARDAAAEAAKFLPEGAAELPPGAFWTALGTAAREQEPERFTRERLESDLAFYQQNLDRLQSR
ncbi:hypothetical protein [Nonomuraea lactucae]|uniref:hypothetical protein n=1 Tax=Nonomuraea lactucae TaxID=2249762 RepID=UPI000DE49877|nr:hypothetical protein [Nonomuraea lactucae]